MQRKNHLLSGYSGPLLIIFVMYLSYFPFILFFLHRLFVYVYCHIVITYFCTFCSVSCITMLWINNCKGRKWHRWVFTRLILTFPCSLSLSSTLPYAIHSIKIKYTLFLFFHCGKNENDEQDDESWNSRPNNKVQRWFSD